MNTSSSSEPLAGGSAACGQSSTGQVSAGYFVQVLTPETVVSAKRSQAGSDEVAPAVRPDNSAALDQWRGLALVLVLISHGFFFTGRVHGLGRVGVNLFFFISGVLVFRSLAKAAGRPARALTVNFWKRRLRRLYPALVAYLLAMLPLTFLLQNRSSLPHSDLESFLKGVPFALAYVINYWPPQSSMSLGHLWSVSCEMQFYLIAPLIFLVGGQSTVRRLVIWGMALAALLTMGFLGPMFDPAGQYKYHFEQAVWPMMLGFGCEYRKVWFQQVSARLAATVVRLSLMVFAASIAFMLFGLPTKRLVIASGTFLFLPCFLAYVNQRDMPGSLGRMLGWLGERTYSIYLWQQPFTICGYLAVAWQPLGAIVSVFVGGVWFRYFERPFLSVARKR
jgi:peptidoglycan/LPS O-acetylase OafA/YrhL